MPIFKAHTQKVIFKLCYFLFLLFFYEVDYAGLVEIEKLFVFEMKSEMRNQKPNR